MLGRRGVEVRNSFHALAKNYKQFWLQIYTSGSDTSVLASNIHLYTYVFYMVYVESGSTLWFLGLRNRKKRYQWYTFSKRFLFQCVTPGLSLRTIFSICRINATDYLGFYSYFYTLCESLAWMQLNCSNVSDLFYQMTIKHEKIFCKYWVYLISCTGKTWKAQVLFMEKLNFRDKQVRSSFLFISLIRREETGWCFSLKCQWNYCFL